MAPSRSSSRSRPAHSRSTSWRSTSSRPEQLNRVQSARHFDDHHVYEQHDSPDDEYIDQGGPGAEEPASQNDNNLESKDGEESDEEEVEEEHESERGSNPSEEKDAEKAWPKKQKPQSLRSQQSKSSAKDPNLVSWDGPDDPQNPKNWSMGRKWAATFIVSSFTFISPVSSSMVAPALRAIARELDISSEVSLQMSLSIFVLAYAIGPLFLGPLSEVYGRVRVLQLANLFYFIWNLACGFAQNEAEMITFRFLSGIGGSAPLAIGGGVLADCLSADQRGKALSIYTLAPLLGPAAGPIAGGFIAQYSDWRWVFWATSIACVAIQISGLFWLQETYAPELLRRKAAKLRKSTGNTALHTEYESPEKTLPVVLRTALNRPFRLLFTQPIIQLIAVYQAYLYGIMYLILSTFPTLFTDVYHESVSIGSLNYISLGLGFGLGTQITAPINDRIYHRLKVRNNNTGRPEFRIPLMFVGSSLIPIGLFWYGWSAQARIHWIMPNIGAAIFASGSILCFQCMQTYIVDAYTRYAASGVAATVVLRSLAGFGFPLFAPAMYSKLSYGYGNTVLGVLAIVIGIPAPFIFWFFGERLRGKSQFAAGGDK